MKTVASYLSLFLFYFLLFPLTTVGQAGLPYLTHYKVPSQLGTRMWGIVQGENQEMFFLNKKGVYSFDGYGWEMLPLKDRPIAFCNHAKLYVSTEKGIVSFKRASKGAFISTPVIGKVNDFFHKFVMEGQNLYAIGTQNIMQVMPGEPELLKSVYSEQDSTRYVTDAFTLNGKLFIVQNKSHIFLVRSAHAIPLSLSLPYLVDINFVFGNNKAVFIGLSNNKLFRFDGKNVSQVMLKDQPYLEESYLAGGIMIDDKHMALSTMLGGSVVVDIGTGESVAMINYSAGLPDDEISALGLDGQNGLWLAHGMGVSRIDFKLPLTTFTHYPGLSGNLLSVAEFDNLLYVGTSDGLYVLTLQKDYKETVISVKERIESPKIVSSPSIPVESKTLTDKKKKGFFGRMFSSDTEKAEEVKTFDRGITEAKAPETIRVSKKKVITLQSVSRVYRRVLGVEGKCQQLMELNGTLLAVTSRGVFEITSESSVPLVVGKNIRIATHSALNKSLLWLGGDDGISSLEKTGNVWKYNSAISVGNDVPTSLVELSIDELLVSTESKVLRVLVGGKGAPLNLPVNGMRFDSPIVRQISGAVRIISSGNVYTYNQVNNSVVLDSIEFPHPVSQMILTQDQISWLCIDRTWKCYSGKGVIDNPNTPFISLFDRVNAIFVNKTNELLVVNGFKEVGRVAVPKGFENPATIPLVVKWAEDRDGKLLDLDDIVLTYANNSLKIQFASPAYIKEQSTEYQYIIDGKMSRWTTWSSSPIIDFPFFSSGSYSLKVRARDLLGRQSSIYALNFRIKPPFWKSIWFISICVFVFLVFVFFFIRVREQRLLHDKIVLEQKVRIRTQTIEEQKEELESQRDALAQQNEDISQKSEEIEAQRDEIEAQRDHIFKQRENITKSIEYAKKIQIAAMPSREAVNEILPEHFILFRPRDIVSGDFFWTTSYHGKIIVAAADCTGHGVPGAFMSMLGLSFLNEVVVKIDDLNPALILNKLRAFIMSTLSQRGVEGGSKDGMDIALCIIDFENRTLEFAGAYNPLYYIQDGLVREVKGDKMPVGIHINEEVTFTNHTLSLDGISAFYIFSDGFVDQFGGEVGKKFMARKFKALIGDIQEKTMVEQGVMLEEILDKWQGSNEQVDDVLVIGVKLV
ncbi:SpoIIE family protein phosphatase [Williamwhitmania taraxaci]|uniref:Serine phosphatase RsbU, regulator of sigma subunit n=1 Tax=Williamwhitmania taraxaci TaxID=1640674 RepID=A0A1G6N6W8_9BACT|nr:SpoIIE family protein phosphatase [Williamwhitmania taraxaci]SDC63441.1 Serine phosphatase RsbU, regulator of sigma subunit [Williamwhitmania taraxaci]